MSNNNTFAIVTDSTADLPASFYRDHDVHVVPLHVVTPDREYTDGVDLTADEYLDILDRGGDLPRTSQPSPADFITMYEGLKAQGYAEILSIHISSTLSGTCSAAMQIASAFDERGCHVEVFDSRITTAGLAVMVAEAVLARDRGLSLVDTVARLDAVRKTSEIHFVPYSVDNLVKGGRMSSLTGMAASLLDIKPVILVDPDCRLTAPAKCRGMKSGVAKAVKMLAARAAELGGLAYVRLQAHSAEAMALLESGLEKLPPADSRCIGSLTIGPVIATHIGVHSIGVWSCAKSAVSDELDDFLRPYLPEADR